MEERFFCDRLPNGVCVITEEIPYVRSATVGIWISVGSMHEPPEAAGICHALEHMLFKGTATRSARDIAETLDAVGGQLNAFTDKEFTCYHAKVLSEDLPLAVDLLCDMLRNSLFRPADIRCEKRVILEEIHQLEDEPDERVHDILLEKMWPHHPLGRPVIGTRGTVRRLDRDAMLAFIARHYSANRIVVATAGSIRHQDVLEQAGRMLGDLLPEQADRPLPPPVTHQAKRRVTKDTEQAHLCIGLPGCSQVDPDRYPLAVLDAIVGGSSSSRLFQEIREKRGLAYTVGSSPLSYGDAGVLAVYAGTSPDTAEQVLGLVRQEFDRILDKGIGEREVEQARSQLKGSMLLALEGTGSRMTRIAKSHLYFGRILSIDELVAGIDSVSTADVNRLAQAILRRDCTSVIVLGPAGKK